MLTQEMRDRDRDREREKSRDVGSSSGSKRLMLTQAASYAQNARTDAWTAMDECWKRERESSV